MSQGLKKWVGPPTGWYLLAALVLLLDQWSKAAVLANLEYNTPLVFTSFFNFTLHYNPGAAFSFLSDASGWQRWFFSALAAVLSLVFVVWIARLGSRKWLESMALAFILGGALGNLYDRLALGHVVDFIVVHYRDYYFPTFNLADAAITLGAFLLIVDALVISRGKDNE